MKHYALTFGCRFFTSEFLSDGHLSVCWYSFECPKFHWECQLFWELPAEILLFISETTVANVNVFLNYRRFLKFCSFIVIFNCFHRKRSILHLWWVSLKILTFAFLPTSENVANDYSFLGKFYILYNLIRLNCEFIENLLIILTKIRWEIYYVKKIRPRNFLFLAFIIIDKRVTLKIVNSVWYFTWITFKTAISKRNVPLY